MTDVRQIVGVWLLRDEEYFVAWSLMNAIRFFDQILVMNNRSRDRTRNIVEAIAEQHGHVEILDVENARDTHKYLEDYAGTPTWVCGIDGDEIFDPKGLARLRPRLLAGEFDGYWRIAGHMRHVLGIRFDRARAFGYAQPEAPEVTKFYNFGAVDSWRPGPHERLHGYKSIVFKSAYSRNSVFRLWSHATWETADIRCLHLAFMPRSSLDTMPDCGNMAPTGRANPRERRRKNTLPRHIRDAISRFLIPNYDVTQNYKYAKYAKGPIAHFDIRDFGAPDLFRMFDSEFADTLRAIRAITHQRERTRAQT